MSRNPRRLSGLCFLLLLTLVCFTPVVASAQTIARCGEGWLEKIDGYYVLHLKGTHYEMGYQQGALLKEDVRKNMYNLLNEKGDMTLIDLGPVKLKPRQAIETVVQIQKPYTPQKYVDEMRGLAAGAEIAYEDVRATNFIPEMFHCSGFSIANSATKDGTLYHGRVLDYACDWGLQDHAVLVVAEPKGGIPFVNVSYAGFIGSVTGMNMQSVSIGEMGGRGLGHWSGVPMAFLVREVLETAKDLDEAIAVFRDNYRTCEYYYVIADGKTNRSVGMATSWEKMELIQPGEAHPLLPNPVKDSALLSAGDRYQELSKRVKQGYGEFTAESAIELMSRPVAMKSNLHNVLFEPKSTKLWVANASSDGKPAANQKYYGFQLSELLKRKPDSSAPVYPMPTGQAVSQKTE
ncbi:C45 family autoproteolytic acyltransferase/hydolase [Gimesia sp.]|uniref:C45 family autoproteolytic acyltransferase/hydolase n=1 Tax=Gimesia sp. TaxID=2024833 RepID=UPI000C686C38|nr:C45 family autoproteolytic acyltransferase/hydolase [Gimesia sp.]MAX38010.1 peptidase C45 [Gimesia sp.]HBL45978.1 peptidase C45 [Planctomycetaceae bacterium]|tara:strand:+ start:3687 stop:4901 length:1215 start_codon:yes stop_codon:yes gene_type:complete